MWKDWRGGLSQRRHHYSDVVSEADKACVQVNQSFTFSPLARAKPLEVQFKVIVEEHF